MFSVKNNLFSWRKQTNVELVLPGGTYTGWLNANLSKKETILLPWYAEYSLKWRQREPLKFTHSQVLGCAEPEGAATEWPTQDDV